MASANLVTPLYYWKKTVTARRSEAWLERVAGLVPPERLAIVTGRSGGTVRLEAYLDTPEETASLQRQFRGQIGESRPQDWLGGSTIPAGKPLSFGRRLLITGHPEELPALRDEKPTRHVLCIPAAMAFGTGEHATTAMCLRFLAEVAGPLRGTADWDALDLGTGSGVLALAARCFGARRAIGVDNDPHAVRTARANAVVNGIARVDFRRVDLLRQRWPAAPPGGWPLVMANLFSELLIALLPGIASSLGDGGQLIASGILARQTPEVEAAAQAAGLVVHTRRRRGRWVAYLLTKVHAARQSGDPS